MAEAEAAKLPIIDLCSSDSISTANSIRQACVDYGFFYLVNHGVEEELLARVFEESRKFFSLPLAAKMNLLRKENRGYAPFYAENLDPSSRSKGDSKESFHIGPLEKSCLNQWPSQELLPSWRPTMESYYCKVLSAGKRLISLIALALNLDKDYFEKIGALDKPESFLRLLHYPGELGNSEEEIFGASAHSDYGMITLLVTDGVPGLQICREKFNEPRTWENVIHRNGAFIINIGDMMERWTNCLFRSTLHRVMPTGQERYSEDQVESELVSVNEEVPSTTGRMVTNVVEHDAYAAFNRHIGLLAFFLEPNAECIVQCLESCCSESSPPRFSPIRSGDYLKERFRLTYGS